MRSETKAVYDLLFGRSRISSLHREHIKRGILVPQKNYNTLS